MKSKRQIGYRWHLLWCVAFMGVSLPLTAQTTYSWNSANTTGNWSAPADWTPTTSTVGPTSGDTASLSNLASTTTATYDTSASGTLGTLNMIQSTNAATTTLKLLKSLEITSALNMDSASGPEDIILAGKTLTIDSGATMAIGLATDTALPSQRTWIGASGDVGTVQLNGSLVMADDDSAGAWFQFYGNTTLAVASTGTINLAAAGGANRFYLGTLNAATGATIESTSTGAAATTGQSLFIEGNATIGTGVTWSGWGAGSVSLYSINQNTAQTYSIGSPIEFVVRDNNAPNGTTDNPTSATPFLVTQTYISTASGNAVDELQLSIGGLSAYQNQILKLGSNLVLNTLTGSTISGQTGSVPFAFAAATGTVIGGNSQTIDLAGFSYDAATNNTTTGTFTGAFAPTVSVTTGVTAIDDSLFINNSSGSSSIGSTIANSQGVFAATSFDLHAVDMGIGGNVILEATGAGVANNLSQVAGGVTTINSASTFYYTGTQGTGTATLTSNRSIGGLLVGNSSNAATLQMLSAITTTGNTQVNRNATLDLNNHALALNAQNLIGAGTVASTTAGGTIGFTTGGLTPGGGTAGATVAALTINSGVTTNLGVASTSISTSVFNFASSSSYDQILGSGTINLNDATLTINLLSGFSISGSSSTFNLFSGTTSLNGTFNDASNVTLEGVNANLYTASISGDLLTLDVVAVPEPSPEWLLGIGLGALVMWGSRLRRGVSREA